MGVHDSGPSFVVSGDDNGESSLKDWIAQNPAALGHKVFTNWGPHLPFLFKILSVAKALSIQAHPDKELAKQLHKSHPIAYKDDNHKPEMALALSEFHALCGFISLQELKDMLQNTPEIKEVVNAEDANQLLQVNDEQNDGGLEIKSRLKSIFTRLMSASKEAAAESASNLKNRLQRESQGRELTEKENLVLQLEKQYPGDVGVIAALFLNYVKLKPGQALYIGANEPHAYVAGECIEGRPEILKGFALNRYTTRYLPPFDEFEVDRCLLPGGESAVFPAVEGPSIFVIASGEGAMLTAGSSTRDAVVEGDVVFATADTEISVRAGRTELHLYRAGVNSRFLQIL
ncbi:unnamed protein product [Linum tenue]|uniref:mannose-6-phosphate isomerase n=1 Tax=Linum tenue TaxID=586396 RepID=A0AAV0PPN9_9ROSI|nr:unnamed protein product [Linum tenue]